MSWISWEYFYFKALQLFWIRKRKQTLILIRYSTLIDISTTDFPEWTVWFNFWLFFVFLFLSQFLFDNLPRDSADTDLKRKRQKLENCRTLTQYFENNKREDDLSFCFLIILFLGLWDAVSFAFLGFPVEKVGASFNLSAFTVVSVWHCDSLNCFFQESISIFFFEF